MGILYYLYFIFAVIFAVLACIEGINNRLPVFDRLVGFGLSLVWPMLLFVVLIAVLREKRAHASTTYSVAQFREEPVQAPVRAHTRISRRS